MSQLEAAGICPFSGRGPVWFPRANLECPLREFFLNPMISFALPRSPVISDRVSMLVCGASKTKVEEKKVIQRRMSIVPVRVKWKGRREVSEATEVAINIAGVVAQLVDSVKKKNCRVVHTTLPLNISNFYYILFYIFMHWENYWILFNICLYITIEIFTKCKYIS